MSLQQLLMWYHHLLQAMQQDQRPGPPVPSPDPRAPALEPQVSLRAYIWDHGLLGAVEYVAAAVMMWYKHLLQAMLPDHRPGPRAPVKHHWAAAPGSCVSSSAIIWIGRESFIVLLNRRSIAENASGSSTKASSTWPRSPASSVWTFGEYACRHGGSRDDGDGQVLIRHPHVLQGLRPDHRPGPRAPDKHHRAATPGP